MYLKGLPPRLTLAALCDSIRVGRIHRIFLFTTAATATPSDALIAFVTPTAARTFYRSVHTTGLRIAGHLTRPSGIFSDHHAHYGVSEWTQAEIVENGWTRCLLLSNVPNSLALDDVRRHIEEDKDEQANTPVVESVMGNERDRTVQLSLAGIYLAHNVAARLRRRKEYGNVEFTYAADLCEEVSAAPIIDSIQPHEPPAPPPPPPPPPPPLSLFRRALLSTANPNPSCRKLVFTRLPYRPQLSVFAQHIRGGIVEGIYLYTDSKPRHHPVAIVIFRHPIAAWHCYLYLTSTVCVLHASLLPFSEIRADRRTPAHSPPAFARRTVRVKPHVASLARDVATALVALQGSNYVGRPSQLLEAITTDPEDPEAARMVFSQIRVAATVVVRLRSLQTYRGCLFSYVKDPWEDVDMSILEERRKIVRFSLV